MKRLLCSYVSFTRWYWVNCYKFGVEYYRWLFRKFGLAMAMLLVLALVLYLLGV